MIITGLSLALIAVWLVEDLAMPHWLNYYTKKDWFQQKTFQLCTMPWILVWCYHLTCLTGLHTVGTSHISIGRFNTTI